MEAELNGEGNGREIRLCQPCEKGQNDDNEKDSEVFSLLGKKSQNDSRKYSLKVVARQRQ
jgi:hypothetical protein